MRYYNTKNIFLPVLIFIITALTLGFNNNPGSKAKVIHNGNLYYLANTVVIKLKNTPVSGLLKAQNVTAQLNSEFKQFKFTSSYTVFGNQSNAKAFGLNRIMFVKYSSNADPQVVAGKIKKMSNIEWAEPKYVRKVTYTPNDPFFNTQYGLNLINAEQAWDISKGDATVVIGIVDTGVDWKHPDLYANIWHNPTWQNDAATTPGDSIGWDFGGLTGIPDNNPMEDKPFHGTAVAGVASAVTNNNYGIAGIGYNCKIMPVKAAQGNITDSGGNPYIVYGFEGIMYAVDHGAKVVNCSWGGGGYSNYEQSVIDYALSKGTLIVAAAGNDYSNEDFYPASYKGVLAVAATDSNDIKANFSNYAANVSVCAPGVSIYSTFDTLSFSSVSGTSFSSPLTAGLAGLVFSHFPSYTPEQVAQQIRVNSDNIYSKNPQYQYLLGSGRIDAYKALADSNSEAIRATNVSFSDAVAGGNGNNIFEPGETISVKAEFMNYLKPVNNLSVSLVSLNSYSTVVNGSFNVNNVATLDSFSNAASQFTFKISNSVPYDAKLNFILNYSDGSYSDFQLISVTVNPSYVTQSGNNITLTINSKGNYGFNDYPTNLQGQGFEYSGGPNLLFEGALITGDSPTNISDAARGSDQNFEDTSFNVLQHIALKIPGPITAQQTIGMFNDDNAGSTKMGVTTKFQSYTYSNSPNQNFIILRYDFTNSTSSTISNYYAGVFFDWDMVEASGDSDYTAYDTTGNLGYVYHVGGNPDTWVGTALISSNNYGYFGILNDGSDGGINIYDGFTPAEKWQAISNGIGKPQAGPGDISEVTSSGPYTIAPGQTTDVAFVIAAGNNINDLRKSVADARSAYQNIITDVKNEKAVVYSFNLSQNYPNPFNPTTTIKYQIAKAGFVTLKVYNILGKEVATLVNEEKQPGNYYADFNGAGFSSGIYFYRISAGSFVSTKKMILLK